MLAEYNVATHGDRNLLIQRHQRYVPFPYLTYGDWPSIPRVGGSCYSMQTSTGRHTLENPNTNSEKSWGNGRMKRWRRRKMSRMGSLMRWHDITLELHATFTISSRNFIKPSSTNSWRLLEGRKRRLEYRLDAVLKMPKNRHHSSNPRPRKIQLW